MGELGENHVIKTVNQTKTDFNHVYTVNYYDPACRKIDI